MLSETLELNTQNVLPKGFFIPVNEALLSQALEPFRDRKAFKKLSDEEIISAYENLMKATMTSFGIEDEIQFEAKPSTNFFGIFLKPPKIVLNRYLLRLKHSVHTIIHECTHAYFYIIRTKKIPFEETDLYNAFSKIYNNYQKASCFHIQPEELIADLVAYQVLQKFEFPKEYSISSKRTTTKINNIKLKTTFTISEFILMMVLLISPQFLPPPASLIGLVAFYFVAMDILPKLFWLEDCLKGRSKQQLVTERFEELTALRKKS